MVGLGGKTITVNGIGTWSSPDTRIKDDESANFINQLSGENINIVDNQYLVRFDKLNLINKDTMVAERTNSYGWANCEYAGSGIYGVGGYEPVPWIKTTKLNIYGHKYDTKSGIKL